MEIPWGIMGITALITLLCLLAIFLIYYLSKFLLTEGNKKANTEQKLSKKQITFKSVVNTAIISIPLLLVAVFMGLTPYFSSKADTPESEAIYVAQELVKKQLLSPSSAEFPWSHEEYSVARDGNQFQVVSYVDSDNAFGASLRKVFVVIFEYYPETETYSLIDFSIE